jgi:membrane protease YdiL (CAAX protease family)
VTGEPTGDRAPVPGLAPPSVPGPTIAGLIFVPIVVLILSGLAQILAMLAVSLFDRSGGAPPTSAAALTALLLSPPGFIASQIAGCLVTIAILFGASLGESDDVRSRLGLRAPRVARTIYPAAVLADVCFTALGILIAASLVRAGALPAIGETRTRMHDAFHVSGAWMAFGVVFAGSALSGVSEELLYRGYLQRGALRFLRPRVALPVIAVLFALAHGDLNYAIFVLPAALWTGWLAWRVDSILPTVVSHAVVNAIGQSFAVGGGGPSGVDARALPAKDFAWLLAAVLVLLPGALWAIRVARAAPHPSAATDPE